MLLLLLKFVKLVVVVLLAVELLEGGGGVCRGVRHIRLGTSDTLDLLQTKLLYLLVQVLVPLLSVE